MRARPVMFCAPFAACVVATLGCAARVERSPARDVDDACGGPRWRQSGALSADIRITRADGGTFAGRMLYDVAGNRIVLRGRDGRSPGQMGCDGGSLWVRCGADSPASDWDDLVLWATYVAVPFRLTEERVRVTAVPRPRGESGRVATVSYRRGTRDDGAGSCLLRVGPDSLPVALTPRVPHDAVPASARGRSEAGGGLYGLTYTGFSECGGVRVPNAWIVARHDPGSAAPPAPAAAVELRRLRFTTPAPDAFDAPSEFRPPAAPRGQWVSVESQ